MKEIGTIDELMKELMTKENYFFSFVYFFEKVNLIKVNNVIHLQVRLIF